MGTMLASTPTAAQPSEVIGQVAARAFLLGAVAAFVLGVERAIDPRHRSLTNIKCDQRRQPVRRV
jgi:hypothetical protein